MIVLEVRMKLPVINVHTKMCYDDHNLDMTKHRVIYILPVTMAENDGESVMDYLVCFDDASQ